MSEQTTDSIPLADTFVFEGPSESGLCSATFYAFNTVVTLQAYATDSAAKCASGGCGNRSPQRQRSLRYFRSRS
ncbi:MAG: hypothetical protein ACLRX5_01040 [Slackia sp.]